VTVDLALARSLREMLDDLGLDVMADGRIVKTRNAPGNIGVRADYALGRAMLPLLAALAPQEQPLQQTDLTTDKAMGYPHAYLADVAQRRPDTVKANALAGAAAHLHGMVGTDPREVAKAKGLKLWNGGGYGAVRSVDAIAHGHRDPSGVHVYACAKSRAALVRMIAAYQGLPGPERLQAGTQAQVKNHWNEGNWGVHMEGIEPEPGIWVQWHSNEKPVRVWPKETAHG
jgi:hypothetical protein